ncbi:MAG: efflux RND transporter periplasmic adaptor subunit, partial [Dokdonella sp.]
MSVTFIRGCRKSPFALLLLALLAPAVQAQTPITLDADQQRLLGVHSAVAVPAPHLVLPHLSATVEAAFDATAVVTAPYAGTVTRVLQLEGAQVNAGQVLARIQSRDVLSLEAASVRAGSEAQLARSQAQRDQQLVDEGIIAASRAQGSAARAAQANASQREASLGLKLAPRPADAAPGEYELRAPVAGRILQRHVVPGQSIEALASAFLIGSGDAVDVSIRVHAAQAAQIERGTIVSIDGSAASCEIIAAALAADVSTQSVLMRARCENASDLMPGQHVQASISPQAPDGAIEIPRTALIRIDQVAGIYVQSGDSYQHVAVEVLGTTGDNVIVRGEIPGDA